MSAPSILELNAFDPARAGDLAPGTVELLGRRQRALGRDAMLFYREPIVAVRAEGVWIHAADGRRYLDAYNNVPSVGHSHPRVVAAMARQAAELNTHTRYLTEQVAAYADRLLATMAAALDTIVFTCTGSEANDLALRVAAAATGHAGVIVTENAYHGNTAAVTAISPSAGSKVGDRAHVRVVPAPRGSGEAFAASVQAAAADLASTGHGVSALVVDTIFSSDGVFADPPGFLAPAVAAVRAAGGLFVADEVQPGFGRTGTMWGYDRHGVAPDLATMGKPMGNGYPMAALAARADLLAAFAATCGYFNTFGGSTVAAAVGAAVLDVLEDEGLIENAARVGGHFRGRLEDVCAAYGDRLEVRGAGLFVAVEYRGADGRALATGAIEAMKEAGILTGAAGAGASTLKIRPPLCFSTGDADLFVDSLAEVLRRQFA